MDDATESLYEYTLSRAEFFYLDCQVKNPKDVWNEFTIIDNDNFDFSKTTTLLNQNSKKLFFTRKKEGKCNDVLWIEIY